MTGGGHAALPRQPRDCVQEGGDQPGQRVPGLPPGQQGHHRQGPSLSHIQWTFLKFIQSFPSDRILKTCTFLFTFQQQQGKNRKPRIFLNKRNVFKVDDLTVSAGQVGWASTSPPDRRWPSVDEAAVGSPPWSWASWGWPGKYRYNGEISSNLSLINLCNQMQVC